LHPPLLLAVDDTMHVRWTVPSLARAYENAIPFGSSAVTV
jgi:hypothetical protein